MCNSHNIGIFLVRTGCVYLCIFLFQMGICVDTLPYTIQNTSVFIDIPAFTHLHTIIHICLYQCFDTFESPHPLSPFIWNIIIIGDVELLLVVFQVADEGIPL